MYIFQIKFVSTKKYEPKIERVTKIKAANILDCRTIFKRNFKEVEPVEINIVDENDNVIEALLSKTEDK